LLYERKRRSQQCYPATGTPASPTSFRAERGDDEQVQTADNAAFFRGDPVTPAGLAAVGAGEMPDNAVVIAECR